MYWDIIRQVVQFAFFLYFGIGAVVTIIYLAKKLFETWDLPIFFLMAHGKSIAIVVGIFVLALFVLYCFSPGAAMAGLFVWVQLLVYVAGLGVMALVALFLVHCLVWPLVIPVLRTD